MDIQAIIQSRLSTATKMEVLADIAHHEGLSLCMLLTMHKIKFIV